MIAILITFISVLLKLCFWAIFIHVLMSWFASGRTQFGEILDQIVQPILHPFRWARIGMLDLSPIVALIALDLAANFLVQILLKYQ